MARLRHRKPGNERQMPQQRTLDRKRMVIELTTRQLIELLNRLVPDPELSFNLKHGNTTV